MYFSTRRGAPPIIWLKILSPSINFARVPIGAGTPTGDAIVVVANGRRKKITKREAIVTQLVNKSAAADLKATQIVLAMLRDLESQTDGSADPAVFTEADQEIIRRPHRSWTGSRRRCRAGAFSSITGGAPRSASSAASRHRQNRIRPRFHGMAGRAGEAEDSRLNRGTSSVPQPQVSHHIRVPSPSGWDREFESGLLQRGVCKLSVPYG